MRPRMRPGKGSCHAEDAEDAEDVEAKTIFGVQRRRCLAGEPRALYFLPACSVRSAIQRAFLGHRFRSARGRL